MQLLRRHSEPPKILTATRVNVDWVNLSVGTHSHQAKAKMKTKIFFDVWNFFFDLFH